MPNVVYILINETMPGLVKVGHTNADLAQRIRQLWTTGVPLPFELHFACEVTNGQFVEAQLHEAFGDHRVSKNREFFRISPDRVKAALLLACVREVHLGDEIFETPEVKSEVETARRRSRFRFETIGIPPDTELQLARDPSITCRSHDAENKVVFNGEVTSLSDAALKAVRSMGIGWPSVSGPWEWSYQGRRLDDIRREAEGAS